MKQRKKMVTFITMLSILSTNIPLSPVYAAVNMNNDNSVALNTSENNLTFHSDSKDSAADDGMDDWQNNTNLDNTEDLDSLSNPDANDSEDETESQNPAENSILDNGENSNSNSGEEKDLISENDIVDPEIPEGNDTLIPKTSPDDDSLISENPSEDTNLSLENPPDENNLVSENLNLNDSLVSEIAEEAADYHNLTQEDNSDADEIQDSNCTYEQKDGVIIISSEDDFEAWSNKDNASNDPLEIVIKNVTTIPDDAFSDCSNLTTITLPDGLISIGENAFSGCSNLTTITLPDGLESISKNAFLDCSGLTEVTIPASVTKIGYYAFGQCQNLKKVTFLGKEAPRNTDPYNGADGLYLPFGAENPFLAVYLPYSAYYGYQRDENGNLLPNEDAPESKYDTQLASWYTLWYRPALHAQLAGDTPRFKLLLPTSYVDFWSKNPQYNPDDESSSQYLKREVTYSFRLKIKTSNGWKYVTENYIQITDKDGFNPTKIINLTSGFFSEGGIYRCEIQAICTGAAYLKDGEPYPYTFTWESEDYTWTTEGAERVDGTEGSTPSTSPSPDAEEEEEDEEDEEDDDSSKNEEVSNPSQNKDNSDSSQSNGFSTYPTYNITSSGGPSQGSGNFTGLHPNGSSNINGNLVGGGNTHLNSGNNASQSNNNTSNSNSIGNIILKCINSVKHNINFYLIMCICILFAVRIIVLIIGARKNRTAI